MLAVEISKIARQRMEKFAYAGEDRRSKIRSTMSEKVFAAVQVGMSWLAIASAS
jgi:hypothetical protein